MRRVWLAATVLYAALLLALHIIRPWEAYPLLQPAVTVATPLFPIVFGILSARYFGRTLQGWSILLLTAASALWLVADILWMLSESAVVSVSDALWLAGYPLIFIGVALGIRTVDPEYFHDKRRVAFLLAVMAAVGAAYFTFFPVSWNPEVSLVENAVTSGYVVADIVIIIPAILLLSLVMSGKLNMPWSLIILALIFTTISDMAYAVQYETYSSGDVLDLGWYFGYLLFAGAFMLFRANSERMLKDMGNTVSKRK